MLAVIIPVYNRKQLFEEALKSLTLQTKKMFITVVVDDASQENIKEIVDNYRNMLHIVYLRQESNQGVGAARARGLQWCFDNNMELVMFLDSDDLLLPKAVERLSKEINVTGKDIITSNVQTEDKNGFTYKLENSETIWTHGKIYRTSFLKQINLNFPNLRMNEDLAFNTVAFFAAFSKNNVAKIEEQHYFWRHDKKSLTRANDKKKVICGISSGFIEAISFCLDKFLELDIDLNFLIPKIAAIYIYVQYLKCYGEYSQNSKELVKKIYNNPRLKPKLKENVHSTKDNSFVILPSGQVYLNQLFIFEQTLKSFLIENEILEN